MALSFFHPCLSVFICGSHFLFTGRLKKIAASAPSQGVVAGTERFAASMAAQPGGMSAAILHTHVIAAAKVRRQSLEIRLFVDAAYYWQQRLYLSSIQLLSRLGQRAGDRVDRRRRSRAHIQHKETLGGRSCDQLITGIP
jgi:hypothetical protein